jgi:hypothetical protein
MSLDFELLQQSVSKTKIQLIKQAIFQSKTQWLREYLSENLPALNLPHANYQAWFDDFIQTLESRGLSQPSQQKNRITDVRNSIKVFDQNHPALDVIKLSHETWVEINEADRDRIAERFTKFIDNPDAIVNTAIELIKTNNWSDIAAGLAVLTGRRCGEIIKTAQFEYKSKYSVTFTGALKRRNEAKELEFEIPTLCQADLIIKAIDCLRLQLGDEVRSLSIRQINQRYEERVANKCDRHFSDLVPPREGKDNLYSHLFRAVYATIACYWYCPPTVPEMEFRAAIQGHYQLLKKKMTSCDVLLLLVDTILTIKLLTVWVISTADLVSNSLYLELKLLNSFNKSIGQRCRPNRPPLDFNRGLKN